MQKRSDQANSCHNGAQPNVLVKNCVHLGRYISVHLKGFCSAVLLCEAGNGLDRGGGGGEWEGERHKMRS